MITPDSRRLVLQLAKALVAVLALALLLRLVLGAHWFSFYGIAVCALLATPWFTTILLRRYRAARLRTWPVWLVAAITLSAGLVQIAFWLLFFNSPSLGLAVGIGRAMFLPAIDAIGAGAPPVIAAFWAAAVARVIR